VALYVPSLPFLLSTFYFQLKRFLLGDLLLVGRRRKLPKDPLPHLRVRETVPPSKVILDHNEP
jgi:hypothetical protein